MTRNIFLLSVLIFIVTGFVAPSKASADEQRLEVQGLAITPFLIEADVVPGASSRQIVTLENTTNAPIPIDMSIHDFVPNSSGDAPSFLPTGVESDSRYSLSEWIFITRQPEFSIPPHGRTDVEFVITPPVDAEPGTHYGGLLFSYRPGLQDADITVTQKAGVLVLAKLGRSNEQGDITRLMARSSMDYSSVEFFTSFYNRGNVHVRPKGEVYIENMIGRQVATVPINRDAAVVLPQSERLFESSWQAGWRFGRYTATAVLYYGNPKLEVRAVTHFWVVPWQRILLVAGGAAAVIAAAWILIKQYNQWLIRKALRK